MKLPNWFKIAWWLLLLLLITRFLIHRYPELVLGNAAPSDVFIFFIWVALALIPFFHEINFFGLELKQDIEKTKKELASQISSLRNEVQNSINVRTQINPQFHIPAPPSDARLPHIQEEVRSAVAAAVAELGLSKQPAPSPILQVDDDITLLFQTRYSIERELRRIWNARLATPDDRRTTPVFHITRALSDAELIAPNLAHAIREVYAVCSPAIHGEQPTGKQVDFVREVTPNLIATLKAIE
jgi:hypothetical protein